MPGARRACVVVHGCACCSLIRCFLLQSSPAIQLLASAPDTMSTAKERWASMSAVSCQAKAASSLLFRLRRFTNRTRLSLVCWGVEARKQELLPLPIEGTEMSARTSSGAPLHPLPPAHKPWLDWNGFKNSVSGPFCFVLCSQFLQGSAST